MTGGGGSQIHPERLRGRVALVTGATGDIGAAISRRLAREGAAVALMDHPGRSERLWDLSESMREDGAAVHVATGDLRDPQAVQTAVDGAAEVLGKLDILVNNAAAVTPVAPVDALALDDWRDALDINLTGAFLTSRAALPHLRRAGGGCIIHIASQLGSVAVAGSAAYCATKAALIQLAKAMALDHAADNIRVVSLSPGAVMTSRLTDRYGSEQQASERLAPKHPIGRIGRPEDVAAAAAYLASDDAAFVTGSDLLVDGGYTAW